MAIAAGAVDFGARHAVTVSVFSATFPSAIGWKKLGQPVPEWNSNRTKTAAARNRRRHRRLLLVVEQRAAKRPLGAAATEHFKLFRRKPLSPLVVAQLDLGRIDGADESSLAIEYTDFDHF